MIVTIADFLLELKNKHLELAKKYHNIKHPGLIGSMYEGLTQDILSKSIFKGLDLRIASGKIKNSKKELSGEIDCMLVLGEGEQIPFSDKYIYDISKVISVIQVKKNLFSKDLKDSFENLRSVIDIFEHRTGEAFHGRMVKNAWRLTRNQELPEEADLAALSFEDKMLYQVFLMEAFLPARIVWGYYGFKSESSLRESLVDYLEDSISQASGSIHGFGPFSFPNLVVCDKFSLIKSNGLPFVGQIKADKWWPFFVSSNRNPLYYLLEIIWTRLHYMFKINAEIFGDDLDIENLHGFILARYTITKEKKGWEYYVVPSEKEFLKIPLNNQDWEPAFLDEIQYALINKLCLQEFIDLATPENISFLIQNGYTIDSLVKSLIPTGLVDVKGTRLSLITDNCACLITPDKKLVAAENKTGRLTRWFEKRYGKSNTSE